MADAVAKPVRPRKRAPRPEQPLSEAQIAEIVRAQVEAQFAKENQLLRDSVGLAAKIAGAALALFLAIFTLLGISTWRDIRKDTSSIVAREARALIDKGGSGANVEETLNALMNKALVSATLTKISRDGSAEVLELSANDWSRLKAWVKHEDLEEQDFKDALAVLNAQPRDRKASDANGFLSEMLDPPQQSPYRWMVRQPEKTEAILSIFKHQALGAAAVEIVKSQRASDTIRVKAAEYVSSVRFSEGVDDLVRAYDSLPEGRPRESVLIACWELAPDNAQVQAITRKVLASTQTADSTRFVGRLIASSSRPRFTTSEEEALAPLKREMLIHGIKHGIAFRLSEPPDGAGEMAFRSSLEDPKPRPLPRVSIWARTSRSSASGADALSLAELERSRVYWDLLGELASRGDLTGFSRLLLGRDFGNAFGGEARIAVSIAANAGAVVSVNSAGSIQNLDLMKLNKPRVMGSGMPQEDEVTLSWTEGAGAIRSGRVTGLRGSGYRLALVRNTRPGSADMND